MNKRPFAVALVVMALWVARGAHASEPQKPTRAHVLALLTSYDQAVPAATFAAMGSAGRDLLIAIASDPREPSYVRMRACSALEGFKESAVRTALKGIMADRATPVPVARQAVLSLGRTFGSDAIRDLKPVLDHVEIFLREAAVIALSRIGTAEARAVLEAHRATETHPSVLRAIDRAKDQSPR